MIAVAIVSNVILPPGYDASASSLQKGAGEECLCLSICLTQGMIVARNHPNVRCGSQPDMTLLNFDVRFTPESGHSPTRSGCLLWAINGHSTRLFDYFISKQLHPIR